jgi:hypothetical protein
MTLGSGKTGEVPPNENAGCGCLLLFIALAVFAPGFLHGLIEWISATVNGFLGLVAAIVWWILSWIHAVRM